jgi:hypothetical protein
MGHARARAAAVVLLLALVAWFAAPPVGAAGPFSFPHRPHLSAAAISACGTPGGSDADCRGCHKYEKSERDAHLVGCDKCHVDDKHLEVKRTGVAARPEFQHKEHLFAKDGSARKDITCFTCHAMRVDYDFIEFSVPTAGLGPKGVGGKSGGAHGEKTCADCHAAHETTGGLVKQDEKTGDGKTCAVCHMKQTSILPLKYCGDTRPATIKPFAHADHGAATADCAACHDGIKTSRTIWDYDPAKGTAEKCASCHVAKDGPLVKPAAEPSSPLKNVDFDNFPHAKHLGEFSKMTCATCHFPEIDEQGKKVFPGRVASSEPVGRSALVNFKACDACHGHDGWGPEKKSWHVDGHGVGAWACFKCHEGVADAAGKLAIATAKVMPRTGRSFEVLTHAHPGVTTRGAALPDATQAVAGATKQCTDCHIGNVADLESRLKSKSFLHDPHVPTTPTVSNCVSCHKDADVARRSEDLNVLGEFGNCTVCHVGMKRASGAPMTATRVVPQFDHANHVRSASLVAGEKGIGCVECHVPGGELGYQIPADVLNCTKCHAHTGDAAKVKRTGPKTSKDTDAKACGNCHGPLHGEDSGSIRMPRNEVPARQHLVLKPDGVQFHDKTGDCAACHVRDALAAAPYAERISSAKVLGSIHEDAAFADKPFNDPKGKCDECHRVEPRGYLKALKR